MCSYLATVIIFPSSPCAIDNHYSVAVLIVTMYFGCMHAYCFFLVPLSFNFGIY